MCGPNRAWRHLCSYYCQGCRTLNVLITRPEADSLALKTEVEALGYKAMVEPLLSIKLISQQEPALEDVQLLVLTSANAVPALSDRAKTYPIYAVGEATAVAARAAGCRNVVAAEGNVRSLSRLIVENCRSQDGTILHLSGEIIREGLAETLHERGFHYRREIAYEAVPRTAFSDDLIDAWQHRSIEAVLVFSQRTAGILMLLLTKHGLERHVDSAAAICLSEEAAAPCKDLVWGSVHVAPRPTRQALLDALVGSTTVC